ncbi:hypothetical protein ACFQE6_05950 [Natrinema soli]|uniref:Uncharacterized protein n=1 Tax=Natrinema soli TaxID=1930624 RepID=A0ABD5SHV3_9EURY
MGEFGVSPACGTVQAPLALEKLLTLFSESSSQHRYLAAGTRITMGVSAFDWRIGSRCG